MLLEVMRRELGDSTPQVAPTRRPLSTVVVSTDGLAAQGLSRLLEHDGVSVETMSTDPGALPYTLRSSAPDVAVIDSSENDPASRAAVSAVLEHRLQFPTCGLLVIGSIESAELARAVPDGRVGILERDVVAEPQRLARTVRHVAAGGTIVNRPSIADRSLVQQLTRRERQVMELIAQGNSNIGIAERLVISVPAVERNVTRIFDKLQLERGAVHHARVLAVLKFLESRA